MGEYRNKYKEQATKYDSDRTEWKEIGNKLLVKEKIIEDQSKQLNELKAERRDIGIRWEEEKKNYRARINRLQIDIEEANNEIDDLTSTLTSHQDMENYLKTVVADLKGQMNDSISASIIDTSDNSKSPQRIFGSSNTLNMDLKGKQECDTEI